MIDITASLALSSHWNLSVIKDDDDSTCISRGYVESFKLNFKLPYALELREIVLTTVESNFLLLFICMFLYFNLNLHLN